MYYIFKAPPKKNRSARRPVILLLTVTLVILTLFVYYVPLNNNQEVSKSNAQIEPKPVNPNNFSKLIAKSTGSVLGETLQSNFSQIKNTVTEISLTLTPAPEPVINRLSDQHVTKNKKSYVIALLGDSMTDTEGEGFPYLQERLRIKIPQVNYDILNYGASATDLVYGLFRLTNGYTYINKEIPSLLSRNPDLIVIESFAYNHWSPSEDDMNKQWATLIKIVDTIKSAGNAKIVFLSTIAPNNAYYGKNIPDIHWTEKQRTEQSETAKKYLINHLNFAKSAKIDYIDAYSVSLDSRNQGMLKYINTSDYLHPSVDGHLLIADLLSDWIVDNLP